MDNEHTVRTSPHQSHQIENSTYLLNKQATTLPRPINCLFINYLITINCLIIGLCNTTWSNLITACSPLQIMWGTLKLKRAICSSIPGPHKIEVAIHTCDC
ncbi:hypothetical protein M758_2G237800 [Ceratodon purpureus]|nr:hypothetical protein M758_2G237800 [Ceratodon purpureus]